VTYGCLLAFRTEMSPFVISVSATSPAPIQPKNLLSVAFSRSRPLSRLIIRRDQVWVCATTQMAIERPGPRCAPVAGRIKALPQVEGLSNSG